MKTVSNFEFIRAKAQEISKLENCVQHIELTMIEEFNGLRRLTYSISDWYDCDKTELSYQNGEIL